MEPVMERVGSSIRCDCGIMVGIDNISCPNCSARIADFARSIYCKVFPDDCSSLATCSWCKQPCERYKGMCPSCGTKDPLAIHCPNCAGTVSFGEDTCKGCGADGFYAKQLVSCGVPSELLSTFTLCRMCRCAFESSNHRCPLCGAVPLPKVVEGSDYNDEPEGLIYLLINSSMPELVKIGKTTRSSEERAAELSNASGVPTGFVVAFEVAVTDCDSAESAVHAELIEFRVNNSREFFKMSLKDAIRRVSDITQPYQSD